MKQQTYPKTVKSQNKKWEVSINKFRTLKDNLFKVTRRMPEFNIQETEFIKSEEMKDFDIKDIRCAEERYSYLAYELESRGTHKEKRDFLELICKSIKQESRSSRQAEILELIEQIAKKEWNCNSNCEFTNKDTDKCKCCGRDKFDSRDNDELYELKRQILDGAKK